VPAEWRSVAVWPERDLPPTFGFRPAQGDDFYLKVTPLYRMDGRSGWPTDEEVRGMSTSTMAKIQSEATEQLELREWKGANASGYYYFATDKAPKSGEYPYMLQGVARLDELTVIYTVLMRRNTPEAIAQMLAVLQTMHRHPRSDADLASGAASAL
jgi:hypothetical protein